MRFASDFDIVFAQVAAPERPRQKNKVKDDFSIYFIFLLSRKKILANKTAT